MTDYERKRRGIDSRHSLPILKTLVKPKLTSKHVSTIQSLRRNIIEMPVMPQSLKTCASVYEKTGSDYETYNSSYSVEKELLTSTQNDVNNESGDVKKNLGDICTQLENTVIDIGMETSNIKDNCSNSENELQTQTSLCDSNSLKSGWRKRNSKDGLGKGIPFFDYTMNSQSEPCEITVENDENIINETLVPSIPVDVKEKPEHTGIPYVDYTKNLQSEPYEIIDENDDNISNETLVPSIPVDVEETPEHTDNLNIYLPRIPPVHTNEELFKLEAFRKLMEISEAGGEILFTIDTPIFYEKPKQ